MQRSRWPPLSSMLFQIIQIVLQRDSELPLAELSSVEETSIFQESGVREQGGQGCLLGVAAGRVMSSEKKRIRWTLPGRRRPCPCVCCRACSRSSERQLGPPVITTPTSSAVSHHARAPPPQPNLRSTAFSSFHGRVYERKNRPTATGTVASLVLCDLVEG
jgi:hypothetical protein